MSKTIDRINIYNHYKPLLKQLVFKDIKLKYRRSFLGYLWSIMNPLIIMIIMVCVFSNMFRFDIENYPVYLIIGQTIYNFVSEATNQAMWSIIGNASLLKKTYVPKYIFLLSKTFVFLFKYIISFAVTIALMIVFKVPVTWQVLNFPLILICLYTVSFGLGTILLHFGVFVEDLSNVTNILLKLVFYMSGIFYAISTRVPDPFNRILLNLNPIALIIDSFRKAFLTGSLINYRMLCIWLIVGIVLSIIGIKTVQKYENSYAKVTK